jgi:predicted ABC-type ATPase
MEEDNKAPPFLLVIAGPNGSGKTTITNALRAKGYDLGEYINPDDITQGLLADNPSPSTQDIFDANRKAQGISEQRRQAALAEGHSLSFETVMSHPSKLDFMREAKGKGYNVSFFFVGTDDPTINLGRVAQRVQDGGHNVPAERILSRYERVMGLLPDAVKISNYARIYDNSRFDDPLRLTAAIQDGKTINALDDPPHWLREHLLNKLDLEGYVLEEGPFKEKADDFKNLSTDELRQKYKDDKAVINAVVIRELSAKFASQHFTNQIDCRRFIEAASHRLAYNIEHGRENKAPLLKDTLQEEEPEQGED